MALRLVHVKIRQNNQVIREADLWLDPKDDRQVRGALLDALEALGEDPAPRHRIDVYTDDGVYLRELRAA